MNFKFNHLLKSGSFSTRNSRYTLYYCTQINKHRLLRKNVKKYHTFNRCKNKNKTKTKFRVNAEKSDPLLKNTDFKKKKKSLTQKNDGYY